MSRAKTPKSLFRRLRFDRLEDRRMLAWGLGELDVTFGSGGVVNLPHDFSWIVRQADGKFISDDTDAWSRFDSAGNVEPSYGGAWTAGFVPASIQSDSAVIGVAGLERNNDSFSTLREVLRVNTDGTLDSALGSAGIASYAYANSHEPERFRDFGTAKSAVVAGGRIIVAGTFQRRAGIGETTTSIDSFALTAFDAVTGEVDDSFGDHGLAVAGFAVPPGAFYEDTGVDSPSFTYSSAAGALLHNDKIVVFGGSSFSLDLYVARFNLDGSADDSFANDGILIIPGNYEFVAAAAVQDGKLLLLTGNNSHLIRLLDSGTLDSTYDNDGIMPIAWPAPGIADGAGLHHTGTQLSVDASNRLVAAASYFYHTSPDTNGSASSVVRINPDGGFDTNFGAGGYATTGTILEIDGLFIEPDGNILVAGSAFNESTQEWAGKLVRILGKDDLDGDGIQNTVDTQPTTFSNVFSDVGTNGGVTTGSITTRGDQILTITDAPIAAQGVLITAAAGGGTTPAQITHDGTTVNLSAGGSYTATHGSVILSVLAGQIDIVFAAEGGPTVATASLSAGSELTFEPEKVTFVAAPTNEQPIQVVLVGDSGQEATATLSANNQITFEPVSFTFSAPESNTGTIEVVVNGEPISVPAGDTVQPVQIEIRPGDPDTALNLASNGVVAVSILSTVDFNAQHVAVGSVIFAGAFATHYDLQDVNSDGRLDMLLHFRTQDTNLRNLYEQLLIDDMDADGVLDSTRQDASIALTGETVDEVLIQGFDDLDLYLAGRALRSLLDQLVFSGVI